MNPAYGILLWILIGMLAGWLASKLMGTSARQGPFLDVLVGIGGALVGGFVTRTLFADTKGNNGFFASLGVSLLGACLLIGIGKLIFKSKQAI